jgi:hypothetical protein
MENTDVSDSQRGHCTVQKRGKRTDRSHANTNTHTTPATTTTTTTTTTPTTMATNSPAKRQKLNAPEEKIKGFLQQVVELGLDSVTCDSSAKGEMVEFLTQILLAAEQFIVNKYEGVQVFYNHTLEHLKKAGYSTLYYQLSPHGLLFDALFRALDIDVMYENARETLGIGGKEIYSSIAILFACAIARRPDHQYEDLYFPEAEALLKKIEEIGRRCTVKFPVMPPEFVAVVFDAPLAMAIVDVE